MASEIGATVSRVVAAIESLAPLALAEPWDRPGIQVGDPRTPVTSVVTALDPSERAVRKAREIRAELLVTHHPLLLQASERIDLSTPAGALIGEILASGLTVYAAHTNLDRADGGVNDALAERLGLGELRPLLPGEAQSKVVVTVPVGYEARVAAAAFSRGAGLLGNYEQCSFGCRGRGGFRPRTGARPFAGEVDSECGVEETRWETVVPRSRQDAVVRAIRDAHPYEEPAIDVYGLEGSGVSGGLGRIGRLPEPLPLAQWALKAGHQLGIRGGRLAGRPDREVGVVAVCGGSGSELWAAAQRAGADVLVTGDVKYHTAQEAAAAGFSILDVGHGPSEVVAVDVLAACLRSWAREAKVALEVTAFREPDPFEWVGF